MDGFADVTRLINDGPGIYALWLGDDCIYIGKSSQVYKRIRQHRANGLFEFNRVMVLFCAGDELDKLEYQAIQHYKPVRNKQSTAEITVKVPMDALLDLLRQARGD